MGVVSAVNVLRELLDEQLAAAARTQRALEILEGGVEVAVVEAAAPTPAVEAVVPATAAAAPKAPAKPKKKAQPSVRGTVQSKYDYVKVAEVAIAAHVAGKPMGGTVAKAFKVTDAMGSWLIGRARDAGHDIPRRGERSAPKSDAVTPAEIRQAVEPVPEDQRMTLPERNEPIDAARFGFASRPTTVEHEVETERHGWKPGMAKELLDVR